MKRLITGLAIVLLVAACADAGGSSAPDSTAEPTTGGEASVGPTAAPPTDAASVEPSAATAKVGEAVTAGTWTVTVNGVEEGKSDNQFITPDPGNVFWIVDVTVVNNGTEAALAGSGITLQDDQDFTHDAELLGIKTPDLSSSVQPGAKTRGFVTFQMAKDAKPATVIFQPDLFDASTAVNIAVS